MEIDEFININPADTYFGSGAGNATGDGTYGACGYGDGNGYGAGSTYGWGNGHGFGSGWGSDDCTGRGEALNYTVYM